MAAVGVGNGKAIAVEIASDTKRVVLRIEEGEKVTAVAMEPSRAIGLASLLLCAATGGRDIVGAMKDVERLARARGLAV